MKKVMYIAHEIMNIDGIKDLIRQGESQTVEFKGSFQEESIQTIGAFANSEGGTLLIGVNDSGVITGTTIGTNTLREIADQIASCTDPRVIPDVQGINIEKKQIIVIQVSEYPVKPVSVRGRCYRRFGDANRLLSPAAIAEMHMATTGTSWDSRLLTDKTIKDINMSLVRRYMELASNIGRRIFPRGTKPREVLEKLELMKDGHPTWAAVLLFGKNPQSPLLQATVHCGRFRTEIDITDDRLIEGSIIKQIDETMDFLRKHINVRFVITGKPRRDEIWDYPLDALREAVVNAICHRDYGSTADIQIKVFDDHIRIWNPGFLPYGVTIKDLYRRTHTSKPRNRLIAQIFYDLEIIERYGSGIQRMLDACVASGLPKPMLEDSMGGFMITFRKVKTLAGKKNSKSTGQVAGQVTGQVTGQVADLLKHVHGEMTRSQLQKALGLRGRDNFLNLYLLPALETGLIAMTVPDKPNSRLQKYCLTDRGRNVLSGK